jgi:DNA-binding response OmpR family regulator
VEKHESQVIYTIELLLGKKHYAPTEVNFCKERDDEPEQPLQPLAKDNDNRLPEQLREDENLRKQAEKDKTIRKKSSRSEYISNFFDNTPLILLIENNRDLADLFKWQLGDRYEVLTATNITEGLKKINLCHPDMVVIGQTFSKINALEVLKCSRKNFRISHIPLVVLAVEGNDDSETKFLGMGVSACVTGPMDKEYLIARLEDLLKKRQQFRERIWNLKDIRQPNDDYAHYLTGKDWRLLEKLVQVMEKNLSNSSFKIENVMPEMKLSHIAFLKKIKGLTGFTSSKLVREVRLNKSEVLLKNTDTTILEIASIVGFKNLKEYETAFFIKHNQTPAKYRDNVQ